MSLNVIILVGERMDMSVREVVFTMNTHEVIYENEYVLYQTFSQNHFACVTRDTITKDFTFIFNGERIKIASGNGDKTDGEWHLCYANPGEVKGYIYAYKENGRWFINYRGATNGGFDDVRCTYSFSGPDQELYTQERDYDYLYKLADRWYADKNGENKRIDFIEKIYEDGRYYLNINGAIVGPYGSVSNIRLTGNGKYSYRFYENRKHYINTNGVVTEEKDYLAFENGYDDLDLTSGDGKHSFSSSYEYVVIDGRPYGQSPAIGAWYDESKNAFIRSAVENRELAVYEYKLK